MTKKDIIFSAIIGLFIAFLIWPLWLNLGVLLNYWSYRWLLVIVCPFISMLVVVIAFWLKKLNDVIWQFAKYALVGVLNTLLDFGILNLLSYLTKIYQGRWLIFFNFFAFFIANINSYFWNKYWSFDKGGKAKTQEFTKFFVVSLIGFGLNSFVLWGITSASPQMNLTPSQWENIGKLGGTLISLIWNFVGYKIFVFKK